MGNRVARLIQRRFVRIGSTRRGIKRTAESLIKGDRMKIYSTMAAAGALALSLSAAQQLNITRTPFGAPARSESGSRKSLGLSDVPEPVQKTIKAHSAPEQVFTIKKKTRRDRTVYDVDFQQKGRNRRMEIDQN